MKNFIIVFSKILYFLLIAVPTALIFYIANEIYFVIKKQFK